MNIENSKESYCGYNDFRRARYFDGEILNKQIFEAEQSYHHEKRKLLNRMLHGWGVVCGLKVRATNPPSSSIIVEKGLALDCHGNEIYVCEDQTVDLSVNACMQKTETTCQDLPKEAQTEKALYVVIRYKEIPSDRAPSYSPTGNCEEKTCDYSRTREGFCIEVWDQPPKTPLKQNSTNMPCSEPFKCPTCCPDPHYIVLATIKCGERTYMVFSNSTQSLGEGQQVEIRYQIQRKIEEVCPEDKNTFIITDTYRYETYSIASNPEWSAKQENLKDSNLNFSINNEDPNKTNNEYTVNYKITSNSKGSFDLGSPVSLSFNQNIIFGFDIKSPIYFGNAEPKRGSIISDSLIRNMENRQIVITNPLLSWFISPLISSLLNISGSEEGQFLSGNIPSSFCRLMEKAIFPEYDMTTKARIPTESEEKLIKEIVEKHLKEYLKSEEEKKQDGKKSGSRYGDIKK